MATWMPRSPSPGSTRRAWARRATTAERRTGTATAAERGHVIARLNIGDFYSRGRGVGLDRVKAWYWLDLAASAGSAWARNRRDVVAARMTPDQIKQAKAMASRH